jgi:hypothetical protein
MMTDNQVIPNLQKPEIVWDIPKRILVIENAISHEMCDSIIEFGNSTVTKGINKYPHVFGVSFHSCLLPLNHEVHNILQSTWQRAIDYFKFDISFVEPYEIKRYTQSDFFGKHSDNYYSLTKDVDRKLTMSVQLSETTEYTGGELMVLGNKSKSKNKGSIVIFPTNFPHEVKPIQSGVRWSLIGWAWGPYWK